MTKTVSAAWRMFTQLKYFASLPRFYSRVMLSLLQATPLNVSKRLRSKNNCRDVRRKPELATFSHYTSLSANVEIY